ncbi:unnamed protein product [Blepharisma stoltei]|uniref:C2 domain-containing protein n=1 Tax=Blepharisma stoltei TaxID=1481888 RepID=A0AAU9JR97_9CILI|nr:unnamed protein product [Blepharisma stoltei]
MAGRKEEQKKEEPEKDSKEKEENEDKGDSAPIAPDPVTFKKGDYTVHIYLEECRALLAANSDSAIDPIVVMKVWNKDKCTKRVSDQGGSINLVWNEHFFFTRENITAEEMANSSIMFEVRDHNTLWKDSLVGQFYMDMSSVYHQSDHAFIHRWILLSNPKDSDFEKVRGYLKVGISVLHETDKTVDLTIREDVSKKDEDILLPPQIRPSTKQVKIRLLKAESLPVLDTLTDSLDAFCVAKIGGSKVVSSVKVADKATLSAYWYEELYLPVMEPCLTNNIILTFYDRDLMCPKDDLVGSISIPWRIVENGRFSQNRWSNLYGAPALIDNEEANRMNMIEELASHWRGRVLLSITSEKNNNSELKVEKIKDPNLPVKIRDEYEVGKDYELRAQVFNSAALPKEKGEYAVKVSFSGVSTSTSVKKAANNRIDWYESCKRKTSLIPHGAENNLPDVFIYLVKDKKSICFHRIRAKDLADVNGKPFWIRFAADKSIGEVKNEWDAGFLRIRIYVGPYDEDNDDLTVGGWDKPPMPPQESKKILVCNLYQCRNLPAADKNGLADPYVKIYCAGALGSTQNEPQERTLNPTWYRTIPIELSIGAFEAVPPIICYVWDWDRIGGDDLIGMTITDITEATINSRTPTPPKWKSLNMGRVGSEMGEILISYNLYDVGQVVEYEIIPEYDDVSIEISILGMRDLHPAVGFMPVNKAFVKFDLNSLRLTGGSLIKKELQTQPGDPGMNPNVNTVLSFTCKLPKDPLYCPTLTCTVHDNLFAGLYQPLIGTFSLYLGDIIQKSKTSVKSVKNEVEKVVEIQNPFRNSITELAKIFNSLGQAPQSEISIKEIADTNTNASLETKTEDHREEEKIETKSNPDQKPRKFALSFKGLFKKENKKKSKEEKPLLEEVDNTYIARGISIALQQSAKQLNLPDADRKLTIDEAIQGHVVRLPLYKTSSKTNKMTEIKIPDPKFYMSLGYNRAPDDGHRHYRLYLDTELENSEYYGESPFCEYELLKGQSRGLDESIFDKADRLDISGQKTNLKCVGKFKGLVRITPRKYLDYKEKIKIIANGGLNLSNSMTLLGGMLEKDREFDEITRQLLVKTPVTVRVYIIDAFDLEQKDRFSASDPYLKVSLGKEEYNLKDEYQSDISNPKFYKFFSFETTLPGASLLKIQVWDHNDVFSDEKIGETRIDLEDRFFSSKWKKLPEKPIETRRLYHKSSRRPQGSIRLWVDVIAGKSQPPIFEIQPRPPAEFEARLIVWECEDIENMDFEGVSDLYVRAWIKQGKEKETDTHYRAQSGRGCWNWRMKFPLTVSQEETNYRLTLQIWDRDMLSRNDFIASSAFDFEDLAKEAWEAGKRTKKYGEADSGMLASLSKKQSDCFWINLSKVDKKGKVSEAGKIKISFELVPKDAALNNPVGEGRSDPNVDPFLPEPTGRFKWSWNPLSLISQMCGPEFKAKICLSICLILCCMMIVFCIPMIFSNIVTAELT